MVNPLQKIAIQRVEDQSDYYLIMWWTNKYKRPSNDPLLLDLTWEELYLDYLVDYYSNNPAELERVKLEEGGKDSQWSGGTSDEYEESIKKKLDRIPQVDISKWQKQVIKGEDEFDETFEDK